MGIMLAKREKIQMFVNEVSKELDVKAPAVEILDDVDFIQLAPLDAKATMSCAFNKIYLRPKSLNRRSVFHELLHLKQRCDEPRKFLEEYEKLSEEFNPEIADFIVERRTESDAIKLAEKYRKVWEMKVEG